MDTRTVSMDSKGVMNQIREHLAGGKSSSEVIALGYKPPTVFKVQRWLRRRGQGGAGTASVQGGTTTPRATVDVGAQAEVERLEAENEELRAQVERLEEEADEADALRLQLEEAQAQGRDLQGQLKALQMTLWDWQEARRDLDRELSTTKARLDDTERSLRAMKEEGAQLRARLNETERRLQAVQGEDAQLRAYLASENCGWQEDFAHWRSHRSVVLVRCTPNQGGQQAHGSPVTLRLHRCTLSKAGS